MNKNIRNIVIRNIIGVMVGFAFGIIVVTFYYLFGGK